MSEPTDLVGEDVEAFLRRHEGLDLLRFITCGSVDDGKSTLIGRLLYESKLIFEDQLEALKADSRTVGTQGGDLDFALLVDGLAAEREQKITIDVAYRFFTTDRRTFIVADTPGHEQYTRNMVTGASTADLAVILVDATKGLLTQTRRHSYLVSLLGIRTVVLAINKLDAVGFDRAIVDQIEFEYREFARGVGIANVAVIPISALRGDNITAASISMPWYQGPTLLEFLETTPVADRAAEGPMRLPVQWVNRPDSTFRGYSGVIVSGRVARGDVVRVLPSGTVSTVERIVTFDGDLTEAVAGQSVTVTLADELDISRGDVIASNTDPPAIADQFEANVVWMSEEPMLPGRSYLLKIGRQTVGATLARPKYSVDANTLQHLGVRTLALNDIGVCNLTVDRPIAFDPYTSNRDTGGFIVIDRVSNSTVAAGMINFALRRADNLRWQAVSVDKSARGELSGQRPCVVWFTGLSGAGKSTIANIVERQLHRRGRNTYLLDGDNVRHGLNHDLGFTAADRVENVRRVAEVARLMVDAGLIVLVSMISPFRAERDLARSLVDDGEFIEVHVDVTLEEAERRDPKGLYAKARQGRLANFTGIDSPYEAPEHPEIRLGTEDLTAEAAAEVVLGFLDGRFRTL